MIEWREGTCYPKALMGVNVGLASVDAVIAVLAFAQVLFSPPCSSLFQRVLLYMWSFC